MGRLVFLQILNEGFYKALAQGQQNVASYGKGLRGSIFVQDRNGELYALAANQKIPYAFVSPAELENTQEAAQALAPILSLEQEEIASRMQNPESLFEVLKKRISKQEAVAIEALQITGVYVGQEEVRSYPQDALASHITGFTNQDGNGQYGIEEYYNDVLEGKEGLQGSSFNPASYILSTLTNRTDDGSDIVLTIDYNMQQMAESLLQDAKERLQFKSGTIIIADPSTGRIFTLANIPSFNPNDYFNQKEIGVFQNSAVEKIFEPGSVIKAITMASALDAGKVTPQTTYTDKGELTISGYTIYNYDFKTHGLKTMAEVLQHSINTGAVFAEQQLGHKNFLSYLKKFKLFESTHIDLAGEVYSANSVVRNGYAINFATAAFGQGIEMTPIQLVRAYTVLANNGVMVEPFLAEHRADKIIETEVISAKSALEVTTMLVNSVDKNIVGKIPGYYIAGKTGTAQVPWSVLGINKPGYAKDQTIQSFIGYFPAYDPQFLILVKLDHPQTKAAGASAIPIFKELAEYLIHYYQIPPEYEV
jgi:cell division protein FtsI/penicillin-binding protein 2